MSDEAAKLLRRWLAEPNAGQTMVLRALTDDYLARVDSPPGVPPNPDLCPGCRSTASTLCVDVGPDSAHEVSCDSCGFCAWGETEVEAIECWNTRAAAKPDPVMKTNPASEPVRWGNYWTHVLIDCKACIEKQPCADNFKLLRTAMGKPPS